MRTPEFFARPGRARASERVWVDSGPIDESGDIAASNVGEGKEAATFLSGLLRQREVGARGIEPRTSPLSGTQEPTTAETKPPCGSHFTESRRICKTAYYTAKTRKKIV